MLPLYPAVIKKLYGFLCQRTVNLHFQAISHFLMTLQIFIKFWIIQVCNKSCIIFVNFSPCKCTRVCWVSVEGVQKHSGFALFNRSICFFCQFEILFEPDPEVPARFFRVAVNELEE